MNAKMELEKMTARLFSVELLKTICLALKEEQELSSCERTEAEYALSRPVLERLLTTEQAAILRSIEKLYEENGCYAMKFSFERGLFSVFQQHFTDTGPRHPFRALVLEQITKMPAMLSHKKYCQRADEINALKNTIEAYTSTEAAKHLENVAIAWEERLFAFLRYAFYLGYRQGLSILQELSSRHLQRNIQENLVLSEHELSFLLREEL